MENTRIFLNILGNRVILKSPFSRFNGVPTEDEYNYEEEETASCSGKCGNLFGFRVHMA